MKYDWIESLQKLTGILGDGFILCVLAPVEHQRGKRWKFPTKVRWTKRYETSWEASAPPAPTLEQLSWRSWAAGRPSFESPSSSTPSLGTAEHLPLETYLSSDRVYKVLSFLCLLLILVHIFHIYLFLDLKDLEIFQDWQLTITLSFVSQLIIPQQNPSLQFILFMQTLVLWRVSPTSFCLLCRGSAASVCP